VREKEFEWLKNNLSCLKSASNVLYKLCENCEIKCNPFGEWTAIKLAFLLWYIGLYTRIIGKNFLEKGSSMIYIDLFAGCGANKYQINAQKYEYFAGSPIIALLFGYKSFTDFILIDSDKRKCEKLNKRIRLISSNEGVNYAIYNEDCNRIVNTILKNIRKPSHYLCFVDPTGMEVEWTTLEKILGYKGDLIVLFHTREVWKNINKARTKNNPLSNTITKFLGGEEWREFREEEELLTYYMDKIKSFDREKITNISIKIKGALSYDLIVAAKKTTGESPWFEKVLRMKERIEKYTPNMVKLAVKILRGDQKSLEQFVEGTNLQQTSILDFT